jgi:hypothetical protein
MKEDKKVADGRFPRNLYKSPGDIQVNKDKSYDTVLVESEDEMKAALKKGYVDSYYDALNGVEPEPDSKDDDF